MATLYLILALLGSDPANVETANAAFDAYVECVDLSDDGYPLWTSDDPTCTPEALYRAIQATDSANR